ncbi:hypothetical protein Poli38472_004602 [Pythium oligandrum]|uniref:6-phosphofructo-2-kinase domain-containing protein n=1 Tax=Pythium oligandrum TaxID=41045 RepID=A0A8K1FIA1_PYTOL|nr:hypothetical protein Poli38472_004602 [Pythium oligandrum]|eukprot:TMW59533.1 hypothetical protein Poli38472_004602 [Pythium oligandrum]
MSTDVDSISSLERRSSSDSDSARPPRAPSSTQSSPERTTAKSSNLAQHRSLSERRLFTPTADKLLLVMVGLPARGKSFIAKKLAKFISWKGNKCDVFNVGQLRRSRCPGTQDHTFFDPNNTRAREERELLARQSLQQVLDWFLGDGVNKGGEIAIFDATNSTKARRRVLLETFADFGKKHKFSIHVVFIESICTNEAVIHANMMQKVSSSPDYRNMSEEQAIADLKQRMKNYEAAYEALDDDEGISYIKLFDLQSRVHAKGIYGKVAKSVLPYMMSFHIVHRPIWLVRAGHCTEVRKDFQSISKDPCVASRSARLSQLGHAYARRLGQFVKDRSAYFSEQLRVEQETTGDYEENENNECPCLILTSTLPRAIETAQYLPEERRSQMASLNPLDKGECYGLSMDEMRQQMPEAYYAYMKNPWKTRFPGGESYYDLMLRVESVLIDIEQHTGPVAVVSHISTLQVLYSYFLGVPIENCSDLEIPFHSVLELVPNQDGWTTTVFNLRSDSSMASPAS